MKLSYCSDSLGKLSFEKMLDKLQSMDIHYVEMTTGGWSPAPHIRIDELLSDSTKLEVFKKALKDHDIEIAALNCSGNPLDPGELGKEHKVVTEKTMELCKLLDVKKVVMMSGLPGGAPGDKIPNWITYTVSWPSSLQDVVDYQWNDIAFLTGKTLLKRLNLAVLKRLL